jgi:hypothetical protein
MHEVVFRQRAPLPKPVPQALPDPHIGQEHINAFGHALLWNGVHWVAPGTNVFHPLVGPRIRPPGDIRDPGTTNGDLQFDNETAQLYTFYDDGVNRQWVVACNI